MKRKIRRLVIEAAENLPYVNLATERIMELSGKDERKYLRFSSRYGKFCRRICKRNGWEPSIDELERIPTAHTVLLHKEESTNG